MRVLIISKFPPIQGGVSTKMYWNTKELSKFVSIDILTNSFDVENQYRENITFLDDNLTHNKKIRLYSTNKFNLPAFIPNYNPIDIKMINKGISLCETNKYDLIIGDYLLPYGFVANYLSNKYKIPYIVGHAGSDLTRLLHSNHYNLVLSKILTEANGIITFKGGKRLFKNLNNKKIFESEYSVPINYFKKYKLLKFNLDNYFNLKSPIYLHVGKLTKFKGIIELINAFSKINFNYTLVLLGNGKHKKLIEKHALRKKVNIIFMDFVPPWLMPSIINKCDYFLSVEHNFGVSIHAPTSFKEAMALKKVCILGNQLKNLPNSDCCLLVDTSDIRNYIDVLNKSNSISKQEYNKLAKISYEYIIQNDSFENNINNLVKFMKGIINDYRKI